MTKFRTPAVASIMLMVLAGPAVAQNAPAQYDIALALDPAGSALSVVVEASGLPCQGDVARVYLNRGLTLTETIIDGRPVEPVIDPAGAEPFWIAASRAIDIPCPREKARLSYAGPGQLHRDGRNQVAPELIELSLYGGWYPMTAIDRPFTWRLRTALPEGWTFASVGAASRTEPGRIDVTSDRATDVVLIASPRFTDDSVEIDGRRSRVLISDDAPIEARQVAAGLAGEAADMSAWLERVLGPVEEGRQVRPELVFTRRGGPLSYSRLPLIVTPQASLLAPGDRPLGLNVRHEVAHFWSRSEGAANDWISEGVAEHLALVRTGDREGDDTRRSRLDLYRQQVEAAGRGVSIADTHTDETRAYINRYQRPALLLDAVQASVGRPALETFLRRLFALGSSLTTATFRSLAVETLGEPQATRISACLISMDWPEVCGGIDAPRPVT
ncbi:hypothetical protein [Brevundimonas aurifodinae]|uniref:Peptidase M1 membrane alanine aminopeptidase domain-containing protein n=1 Tax=Brevundimonas aurifodinae TaxID=1508312 RepID=A0ABV1NL65_9CAUL